LSSNDNKETLKVLFITHNYIRAIGDFAGVFLHLLARKLTEMDFEIYVVAPHDAAVPEYEEIQGVKIYRFRYAADKEETLAYSGDMHRQLFRNPLKIFKLRRFLKASYELASSIIEKENISIVSVHWIVPNGVIGRRLKRKYKDKIRLFFHSHGTDVRILTGTPLMYSFFKSTIKEAEYWTVVSNYLKGLILEKDKDIFDRIKVIPLPNDEKVFYPEEQIVEDPNLVVAVSRLTVQKRLKYLLDAVKLISKGKPSIKLEIYGIGPEKWKLERQIEELGLLGRVRILAPVAQKELRKVYNRAAVVVLNSVDEGFGLALTEAMLCGTAVIGTKSGGITDIIDDGETGLLVPVDDAEKLAESIKIILDNHSLRERLATAGRRRAIDKFSSKSSAAQYAELFGA
jgi:glycosyltransferase involved in cell wall biosynthesis